MLNPNTNPYTHLNAPNINSQGNYGRPKWNQGEFNKGY
jgi:hypothetical protein